MVEEQAWAAMAAAVRNALLLLLLLLLLLPDAGDVPMDMRCALVWANAWCCASRGRRGAALEEVKGRGEGKGGGHLPKCNSFALWECGARHCCSVG